MHHYREQPIHIHTQIINGTKIKPSRFLQYRSFSMSAYPTFVEERNYKHLTFVRGFETNKSIQNQTLGGASRFSHYSDQHNPSDMS